MTAVVEQDLEQLLAPPRDDEDMFHWSVPPFAESLCGMKLDGSKLDDVPSDRKECPTCRDIAGMWVDNDIWEGPGSKPAPKR